MPFFGGKLIALKRRERRFETANSKAAVRQCAWQVGASVSTSASQACGSMSLSLAVYAARRTMRSRVVCRSVVLCLRFNSGEQEEEEYLGRSRRYRHLRSGPPGQFRCLNVVGGLLSWIAGRRYKLVDPMTRVVKQYLRHRGGRQSVQSGDRAALKR